MSDSTFESLADSLLAALEEGIGAHVGANEVDAELQGGILTVDGDEGTWVVNKHAPTRQIWVSSPKSGARHYAFEATSGQWRDTRGGGELLATLSAELGVTLAWRPQ
jgi:frataxin